MLKSIQDVTDYSMTRIIVTTTAGPCYLVRMVLTLTRRGITELFLPMAWGAPAATLGLLRGVRAGWMGRMPDIGWG